MWLLLAIYTAISPASFNERHGQWCQMTQERQEIANRLAGVTAGR
jgi:hypothetical protein